MTLELLPPELPQVVWKTNQQVWAWLHEQAFRALGLPRYVVLDNLKEGVIHPDLYEPELNPVYTATARPLWCRGRRLGVGVVTVG